MPDKDCLTCGESFSVLPSRVDDAKFCSRKCYHEGQKEGHTEHSDRRVEYKEVECTNCETIVEKPPSRVNRSERQFCGEECYYEWSKGHKRKQHGKRKRYREKEQKSCEICGFERYLEICHIVPSKEGGTFHKNNILFLCPNHHRLLDHRGLNMDEFELIENKIRKAIVNGDGWKSPNKSEE